MEESESPATDVATAASTEAPAEKEKGAGDGAPAAAAPKKVTYKAIDKLTAIDRQTGRTVQVWAREKSSCGGSTSMNGESLHLGDYDDLELEEPFSDSDEDDTTRRKPGRPRLQLPLPRRRIRTLSGTVPPVGYAPVWGGPTMCLGCLEFFDLPGQTANYVEHLLHDHKIVIADIELIVDLKRYVEHWRHRFGQDSIEKIFPKLEPEEGHHLHGKVDFVYLMSEAVKEDYDLRERLALRRLEEVLYCQQREREDFSFSRPCLFCRYRARGNRSKIIHHLYMIHHLNLGSPDNLVFVNEYLDLLKSKLDKNQCLYCEKTFMDHMTLMEHMRKRQHREVNPKNSYYDKFYVINYLELGKKWLEVLSEDFEDSMPTFADSDDEEEDDSWHEWQEDNNDETEITVMCLFCDDSFPDATAFLQHLKDQHKYDLAKTFEEEKMGVYDRIKFINCIRKLSYQCNCFVCGEDDLKSWEALRKHLAANDHLATHKPDRPTWDKEEYLVPMFENDHLLWVLESALGETAPEEEEGAEAGAAEPASDSCREVFPEDVPHLESVLADADLRTQLQ